MDLVMKGGGVDIKATFDELDKRISALEGKNNPINKDWKPAEPKQPSRVDKMLASHAPGKEWTPTPPKKV